MTWLDKLERRFGFLSIPGLIRIVIGFTVLVYVLVYFNRGFELFLTLDPVLILRGQVWRLVTYIFLPQTFSPLWVLLALWFLWFIGEGLERAWGPFRLTLYFVVGMIGTTIAAFFFGSNSPMACSSRHCSSHSRDFIPRKSFTSFLFCL